MKPAFMVGFFSSYGPLVCFLEDHVVSGVICERWWMVLYWAPKTRDVLRCLFNFIGVF